MCVPRLTLPFSFLSDTEPQPDDPLEARIAHEYKNDRKEFEKNARAYVQRYAKVVPVNFDGKAPPPPTPIPAHHLA